MKKKPLSFFLSFFLTWLCTMCLLQLDPFFSFAQNSCFSLKSMPIMFVDIVIDPLLLPYKNFVRKSISSLHAEKFLSVLLQYTLYVSELSIKSGDYGARMASYNIIRHQMCNWEWKFYNIIRHQMCNWEWKFYNIIRHQTCTWEWKFYNIIRHQTCTWEWKFSESKITGTQTTFSTNFGGKLSFTHKYRCEDPWSIEGCKW